MEIPNIIDVNGAEIDIFPDSHDQPPVLVIKGNEKGFFSLGNSIIAALQLIGEETFFVDEFNFVKVTNGLRFKINVLDSDERNHHNDGSIVYLSDNEFCWNISEFCLLAVAAQISWLGYGNEVDINHLHFDDMQGDIKLFCCLA